MKTRTKGGIIAASAALVLLATNFIGGWEGRELRAYQDIVRVWTICDGETKGVKPGDVKTPAECDAMLVENLVVYEQGMDRCLTADVPGKAKVAFLSLTYNIGVGAFCKSTALKRINAGNLPGACDAILMFDRAGGQVVRGLTLRREAERKLCIEGLVEGYLNPRPAAPGN